MRRSTYIFFIALVSVTLAPSASISSELTKIRAFCAERWPGNSAKAKACYDRQIAGNKRILAFIKRHDLLRKARVVAAGRAKAGPYIKMFNRCSDKAEIRRHDTHDHVKWVRCLNKRERAYYAKRRANKRAARAAGRVEAVEMIRKMPNISVVAWAGKDKRNHLNVHVHERGQDYAADARAYCDLLKTNGVRDAKVSVWSADAKKKSPPKEVLLTHRLC